MKCDLDQQQSYQKQSLLSQERGLKFPALGYMAQDPVVAPLAGAWIE